MPLKIADTELEGFVSEQTKRAFIYFGGRQEQVCGMKLNRASPNLVGCSHIPLLLSHVKKSGLYLGELAGRQILAGVLLLWPLNLIPSQLLKPETHFPSTTTVLMTIFIICKYFFRESQNGRGWQGPLWVI